jgi:AcrR family transcriptional regulator
VPRLLSADDVATFRGRLCEAAERLFAEQGPEAVTMRQLAADLGCSPMTPYRYFKDKGEILAAVRASAFDRLRQALDQALGAAAGRDAPAQAAVRVYADFALTQPQAYRLMFDLAPLSEAAYPELVRAAEEARNVIVRHLSGAVGPSSGPAWEMSGHRRWAALHGALMLHFAQKLGPDIRVAALIEDLAAVGDRPARSATGG